MDSGLLLIHGAKVYSPKELGKMDILLGGGKILAMAESLETPSNWPIETLDARNLLALPGLVDNHVHITGGGGEAGFGSRTPALSAEDFFSAGITTVVGTLGADGITRTMEELLGRTRELQAAGLDAYCYSGRYQLPLEPLTGDIQKDLVFIPEIIGVGELAISDHRGSHPETQELIRLASQARLAGMIAGKAGIVNLHLGDGKSALDPLFSVIRDSEIPIRQFLPTHLGRNPELFQHSRKWLEAGGYGDFTCCTTQEFLDQGETRPSRALAQLLQETYPLEQITWSTDAGGSLPDFDKDGRLRAMTTGSPQALMDEIRLAVQIEGLDLSIALAPATVNSARALGLDRRGQILVGGPANLVLVDRELDPVHTISQGVIRWSR